MPNLTPEMRAELLTAEPGCRYYVPEPKRYPGLIRLIDEGLVKKLNWCDYELTDDGVKARERLMEERDA